MVSSLWAEGWSGVNGLRAVGSSGLVVRRLWVAVGGCGDRVLFATCNVCFVWLTCAVSL